VLKEQPENHQHINGDLPVASLVPNLLDHLTSVSEVAGTHPRLLAVLRVRHDNPTVALVNLNKLLEEGLNLLTRNGTATLQAADTPSLKGTVLVVHRKLTPGKCQYIQRW
jgi:hypothetical protein